jgi:hypothetical protein
LRQAYHYWQDQPGNNPRVFNESIATRGKSVIAPGTSSARVLLNFSSRSVKLINRRVNVILEAFIAYSAGPSFILPLVFISGFDRAFFI